MKYEEYSVKVFEDGTINWRLWSIQLEMIHNHNFSILLGETFTTILLGEITYHIENNLFTTGVFTDEFVLDNSCSHI